MTEIRRQAGRRIIRRRVIKNRCGAVTVLIAAMALFAALAASCGGGIIRPLFESGDEFTVFQLQNFSLPTLSKDGGVFQFWVETETERFSVLRFVVVDSVLWPPEYHDHDLADLPPGLAQIGTLTNTEVQFDLPEEIEKSDIETVYLTVEPIGPDDGVMSNSILLAGGVNVRGRANMTFDTENAHGGLPNVFQSPAGKIMLAIPTNRPPAQASAATKRNWNATSPIPFRKTSQDGDTAPPVWTDENQTGILTAVFNTGSSAIDITFGAAEDEATPPVSYVAYWQEGYSIDFEDARENGRTIALDITGQENAPYSATITAANIPGIDGPISISVLARDAADPPSETEPLAQNINHSNGRDWLTVGPGDYMPPTWTLGRGITSGTYNVLGTEIDIRFGQAVDALTPPVTYVLYWQQGNEINYALAQEQGRVITLDVSDQAEAPYSYKLTGEDISNMGENLSLSVHARDSANPPNETPVYFPHPTLAGGNDWVTAVAGNPFYQGVWFVTIPEGETEPVSSLNLPDLTDVPGWAYQAWAFHQTDNTLESLGRFKNPAAPAMDGQGPHAGQGAPYNAPGRDFLGTEYDFRNPAWLFYITIEPDPDTSLAGFAWRLLSVGGDADMSPTDELEMVRFTGTPPFGVVRIL